MVPSRQRLTPRHRSPAREKQLLMIFVLADSRRSCDGKRRRVIVKVSSIPSSRPLAALQ